MTRAMRDMEEKRTLCDGVICVLDARAPAATFNQNLQKIFGGKPILYLLNKADLADGGAEEESGEGGKTRENENFAALEGFYGIESVQPFDMFPQTKHVETLVCLERK